MRTINQKGLELIKSFEGLRLEVYFCQAQKLTVGYGHRTTMPLGTKISQEHAEMWLLKDLQEAQQVVEKQTKVKLNDNEFSALVSLTYNIGITAFKKSTLLKLLNKGYYEQVPSQIMRWDKINGEESGGLHRRRKAEVALWREPVREMKDA